MSPAAIQYALEDARSDILTLARLLCEAGYPRRGTPEESQSIYDYAAKVQALIPHAEAVNIGDPVENGPSDSERLDSGEIILTVMGERVHHRGVNLRNAIDAGIREANSESQTGSLILD